TSARSRMLRGETKLLAASRFIREIPSELLDTKGKKTAGAGMAQKASGRSVSRKVKPYGGTYSLPQTNSASDSSKTPEYQQGDMVRHKKFGEGEVLAIQNGGRDFEVTVRFADGKVRKMFASFANLMKV
ncbi:MAG: ATP-dependent DNA helicase PcrA, partial [Lachnospiraceae bacterium]|nr:ATP-dependent DNA helicase PcrA [Lachnospiraceae bacterium]